MTQIHSAVVEECAAAVGSFASASRLLRIRDSLLDTVDREEADASRRWKAMSVTERSNLVGSLAGTGMLALNGDAIGELLYGVPKLTKCKCCEKFVYKNARNEDDVERIQEILLQLASGTTTKGSQLSIVGAHLHENAPPKYQQLEENPKLNAGCEEGGTSSTTTSSPQAATKLKHKTKPTYYIVPPLHIKLDASDATAVKRVCCCLRVAFALLERAHDNFLDYTATVEAEVMVAVMLHMHAAMFDVMLQQGADERAAKAAKQLIMAEEDDAQRKKKKLEAALPRKTTSTTPPPTTEIAQLGKATTTTTTKATSVSVVTQQDEPPIMNQMETETTPESDTPKQCNYSTANLTEPKANPPSGWAVKTSKKSRKSNAQTTTKVDRSPSRRKSVELEDFGWWDPKPVPTATPNSAPVTDSDHLRFNFAMHMRKPRSCPYQPQHPMLKAPLKPAGTVCTNNKTCACSKCIEQVWGMPDPCLSFRTSA